MSTSSEARAWIEVRADALRENYRRIRRAVGPEVRILPMVKADAYGLGVATVVRVLEREDPWGYGVATISEGADLRRLGVALPIVVCSPAPPGEVEKAVAEDLHISVSSLEALGTVADASKRLGRRSHVHVEVDTGMGRSGFDFRTAPNWLPRLVSGIRDGVHWVGWYTHLHSADEAVASVEEQCARMRRALDALDTAPPGLLVHVLNSAGVFRSPSHANAVVRPGIFLYGGEIGDGQPSPSPVVSAYARVVHVREATAGTTVGYGATYRAETDERWATLSIGYGDGLPRALGNRGRALVRGRAVPIIGRISMDVTVVDISDVPEVAVGDKATLFGHDGEESITLDEVASAAGTISYEVLTGLTPRLPRVWRGLDA